MAKSPFDLLFQRNVPHILEKIFLSLDFESYMACHEVSTKWRDLLASESFQRKAKATYPFEKKLCDAAKEGNTGRIRRLLAFGFDINCSKNGTPLYWAAFNRHTDVVKLLLDEGANPEQDNHPPLSCALAFGLGDMARMLLDSGANVKSVCTFPGILAKAARCGHVDIVLDLLNAGADPNETHERMRFIKSPLAEAARYGHVDIVKELLNAGANPNKTRRQTTAFSALDEAIYYAINSSEKVGKDMIKLLLDAGAHPTTNLRHMREYLQNLIWQMRH